MSTPSIVFHREEAPGRSRTAVSAPCRLCGADAALHFVRRHCDGERVAYYLCEGCGSATAFEVWEHYPHPARELGEIFGLTPDFVLRAIVEAGEGGAAADRRRS